MAIDKLLHFFVGFSISAFLCLFFNPLIGLSAAIATGLLKDFVYDLWLGRGTFDWLDIAATVVGGTVPALAVSFRILLWG